MKKSTRRLSHFLGLTSGAPSPSAASRAQTLDDESERLRVNQKALEAFYTVKDPTRVKNVEPLFKRFYEEDIVDAVRAKYGEVPKGWVFSVTTQGSVRESLSMDGSFKFERQNLDDSDSDEDEPKAAVPIPVKASTPKATMVEVSEPVEGVPEPQELAKESDSARDLIASMTSKPVRSSTTPNATTRDPTLQKYRDMLRAGASKNDVTEKMKSEGRDPAELFGAPAAAKPEQSPVPPERPTPAAEPAPAAQEAAPAAAETPVAAEKRASVAAPSAVEKRASVAAPVVAEKRASVAAPAPAEAAPAEAAKRASLAPAKEEEAPPKRASVAPAAEKRASVAASDPPAKRVSVLAPTPEEATKRASVAAPALETAPAKRASVTAAPAEAAKRLSVAASPAEIPASESAPATPAAETPKEATAPSTPVAAAPEEKEEEEGGEDAVADLPIMAAVAAPGPAPRATLYQRKLEEMERKLAEAMQKIDTMEKAAVAAPRKSFFAGVAAAVRRTLAPSKAAAPAPIPEAAPAEPAPAPVAAAPAGGATVYGDDGYARHPRDSPHLEKYRKMMKAQLPQGAIENAMLRDGVHPSSLYDSPLNANPKPIPKPEGAAGGAAAPAPAAAAPPPTAAPAPAADAGGGFKLVDRADPALEKYKKMQKAGLPQGAVENAMMRDMILPASLFDNPFNTPVAAPKLKPAAAPVAAPVAAPASGGASATPRGFTLLPRDDPGLEKYRKMQKAGLPQGPIENAMMRDMIMPASLYDNPLNTPKNPSPKPAAAPAAAELKPPPGMTMLEEMKWRQANKPATPAARPAAAAPAAAAAPVAAPVSGDPSKPPPGLSVMEEMKWRQAYKAANPQPVKEVVIKKVEAPPPPSGPKLGDKMPAGLSMMEEMKWKQQMKALQAAANPTPAAPLQIPAKAAPQSTPAPAFQLKSTGFKPGGGGAAASTPAPASTPSFGGFKLGAPTPAPKFAGFVPTGSKPAAAATPSKAQAPPPPAADAKTVEVVKALLVQVKLAPDVAAKYAAVLAQEGFDEQSKFDVLDEGDLKAMNITARFDVKAILNVKSLPKPAAPAAAGAAKPNAAGLSGPMKPANAAGLSGPMKPANAAGLSGPAKPAVGASSAPKPFGAFGGGTTPSYAAKPPIVTGAVKPAPAPAASASASSSSKPPAFVNPYKAPQLKTNFI